MGFLMFFFFFLKYSSFLFHGFLMCFFKRILVFCFMGFLWCFSRVGVLLVAKPNVFF